MVFIYFTDTDGTAFGLPLSRVFEINFKKDPEGNSDRDVFTIYLDNGQEYNVQGKGAKKAWDEVKLQVKEAAKDNGWRQLDV